MNTGPREYRTDLESVTQEREVDPSQTGRGHSVPLSSSTFAEGPRLSAAVTIVHISIFIRLVGGALSGTLAPCES